jgi:hypothetical protein
MRLGGLFSVALSVDSRPPGVTWRFALGARTFLPVTDEGDTAIAWLTPGAHGGGWSAAPQALSTASYSESFCDHFTASS